MDRIYCGRKVFVPDGYDRFGDRFECLQCGFGSAMMQYKWAPPSLDPQPPPREKKGCYRKKKRRSPPSSRKKKRRSPASSRKKKKRSPASSRKKKKRSPASSRKKKRRSPASSRKKKTRSPASSRKKKKRSPASSRKKKKRSPASSAKINSWQDWLQTPGNPDPDKLLNSRVFDGIESGKLDFGDEYEIEEITPKKLDFEDVYAANEIVYDDEDVSESQLPFDIPDAQDSEAWGQFFKNIKEGNGQNPYLKRIETDLPRASGKRIPRERDFFVP